MLLQLVLKRAEGFAPAPEGDAALLKRFAADRDESAFAALLQRHGPMVWSVCRHLLMDEADAEDAFQATFLALVRSAKGVRNAQAVGAWLHGVAVRVATKAKRSAARRRQREERAAEPEANRPIPEAAWNELLAAVHEEVQRLPEHLRTAFVLCDLEGVRQPDAAARLGWKPGTLTGRLTRARQMLVQRLTNRGLAPAFAGGGLALSLTTASAAVPVQLIDTALSLIRAGGTVSPAILNLVKEATPMMAMRTKLAAALLLFAGGLGAVFFPLANAQPTPGGGPPPATGTGGGPYPGAGAPGLSGAAEFSGPPRTDSGVQPPFLTLGLPTPVTNRTQWEYKFVPGRAQGLPELFAEMGNEGWEFCGTHTVKDGMNPAPPVTLIFKRPKAVVHGSGGGGPGGGGGMAPTIKLPAGSSDAPGGGGAAGIGGGPPVAYGGRSTSTAPAAPAMQIHVFAVRNATVDDLMKVLERVFKSPTSITADPRTNSLIIRADEKTLAEVKSLIEKLDVPNPTPPAKP